jgi:hypothetical protein
MTKFLVLLGLSVTVVLLSPLPSESQFRFVPWWGLDEQSGAERRPVFEPGSLVVVEMSSFGFRFCFSEMPGGEDCQPGAGGAGLPAGTQLISSNETVASVESVEGNTVVLLHRPGNTILQLRGTDEKKRILAIYRLIVSPVDAGTGCSSFVLQSFFGIFFAITDCSGRCVPVSRTDCRSDSPLCVPISERIGDGTCNSGRRLDDGRRDIDLACRTFAFDGGDCVVGKNRSLGIEDCSGHSVDPTGQESINRIRQALSDDICNDESQTINLNCPVFAFDKGRCLP